MLLAYCYAGSFTAIGAVSAWLPLVVVVGISLFFVSLRMEGYALFKESSKGIMRLLFESKDTLGIDKISKGDIYKKEQDLEKYFRGHPVLKWLERLSFYFFNNLIACSLPALAFIGKFSITMVGTISAIVLLSGGMPITSGLLVVGAVAGLCVGLASVLKEGEKTHACVKKYYTLFMHKLCCQNSPNIPSATEIPYSPILPPILQVKRTPDASQAAQLPTSTPNPNSQPKAREVSH